MKKFKIQSFLQKNFFKKNILNKMFSKFFTFFNMPKGTWKISFSQFKKKNRGKISSGNKKLFLDDASNGLFKFVTYIFHFWSPI